jgi:hypothetical protein
MLRPRTRRRLEVPRLAHNRALHYLANAADYRLSPVIRRQLIEVVHAATGGSDDEDAARRGLAWMREQARRKGERAALLARVHGH